MMNDYLMKAQFILLMMIFFILYIIISFLLIPFAWIAGCVDKMFSKNTNYSTMDKVFNYMFIPFGTIVLMLDMIADLYYFWKNSFR